MERKEFGHVSWAPGSYHVTIAAPGGGGGPGGPGGGGGGGGAGRRPPGGGGGQGRRELREIVCPIREERGNLCSHSEKQKNFGDILRAGV